MKFNRANKSRRQSILGSALALACVVALAGCTAGTPLEGTPVEGPLNAAGEFCGKVVRKLGSMASDLFDGPTVEEARESKATEIAPALAGDTLVREGYLTVGIQNRLTSAPFVIEDESGNIQGIDVDFASAIAGELGLKVAFIPVDTIDTSLSGRECDVVMSALTERVSSSMIIGGYGETATVFFHVGDAGAVTADDLSGHTVGLQGGSVSEAALENTNLSMQPVQFSNLNEAFDALEAGEVDYVLCDAYPGAYLAATYQDVAFAGALTTPSAIGIAVATDNAELGTAVENAAQQILINGEMDVIRSRWIGGMQAVTPEDVVAGVSQKSSEEHSEGENAEGEQAEGEQTEGEGEN